MKQAILVALVCLNVALATALVCTAGSPPAYGQVVGGGSDYLVMTGKISGDWDGIYVIDLGSRKLLSLRFDKLKNRIMVSSGADLVRDFGREKK